MANAATLGGKKVAGRTRHVLVDPAGTVLTVVVHRANMPDRDGAAFVLEDVTQHWPTLQMVWADQASTGDLVEEMYQQYGITLELVAKVAGQQGFVVLPRRWVVERTFAWLGRYRRLSKDYEQRGEDSETWVYVASIARMLRSLHPNEAEERPYTRRNRAVATKQMRAVSA